MTANKQFYHLHSWHPSRRFRQYTRPALPFHLRPAPLWMWPTLALIALYLGGLPL